MLMAFANAFRTPDLRRKLLFVLMIIVVFRAGSQIPAPGVDVGNDVPGTGTLAGAGDLPAFVSTFPAASVTSIVIAAGDGDDTIYVHSIKSGTPVTVDGGTGNDTIVVGSTDLDTNIKSGVSVNGDSGTDTLILNDTADNDGNDNYVIGTTTINKSGFEVFPTLTYNGIDALSLQASGFNNTINVNSVPANTDLFLYGNGGNDSFNLGSGNLDQILLGSTATIIGGAGTNSAVINDSIDSGADAYTLTNAAFTKSGIGTIEYSGISSLTINAGTGSNTINVNSASSGISA